MFLTIKVTYEKKRSNNQKCILMKKEINIKVCFSTKAVCRGSIEWERFWEVTNEDGFGRDNASYHVTINNSMPISEFTSISQEIKDIIEYRNNCCVDVSRDGITYNLDGMISVINFYFRRK